MAGPGSGKKWNEELRDGNDPLLFIESIPFVEPRHYVEVVLRNYWMYQQGVGADAESLDALAQGMWPRFPGLPGQSAIRVDPVRPVASANFRTAPVQRSEEHTSELKLIMRTS